MKSHLILTPTVNMTEEQWHFFRFQNGLGASDVGCVLGLTSSWKSPIELFYQKLDPALCLQEENKHMFFGTEMEEKICDWYQYWEGSMNSVIANFRAGKIIRKVQRVNSYIQNPNYPWLFVSLDRKVIGQERVLEAKWISGYVANKFIEGIPPSHMAQLQTQLLVTEYNDGDLATLVDKQDFFVDAFKADQDIFEPIIERTKDFWERVKAARIVVTQKYEAALSHNMRLVQSCEAELANLEPALIGGEAEDMFLKDKYKNGLDKSIGVIKGTEDELKIAKKLKSLKEQIKAINEEASLHENTLKRRIAEANTLDFGKDGKVSWSGSPKRFSNAVKL